MAVLFLGRITPKIETSEVFKMMKHLWLYPLIFAVMIAAILGCMIRIGCLLYQAHENRARIGVELVWEAEHHAAV